MDKTDGGAALGAWAAENFPDFRPVFDDPREISPEVRAFVDLLDEHRKAGMVDELGMIERFRRQTIAGAARKR